MHDIMQKQNKSQMFLFIFASNIKIEQKCDLCDFDCGKWADLTISKTADFLGFR